MRKLLLFMTAALASRKFDIKRAVMVWAADIIHWPFTRAVPMALAFAKERQHAFIICHKDDLTFCIKAEY
jgi:hypothetical protein